MIERKKMYEEAILNIMKMDFIANIYKQIKEKAKNGEFSLTVKFNDFANVEKLQCVFEEFEYTVKHSVSVEDNEYVHIVNISWN